MHKYIIHVITVVAVLVIVATDIARARPNETFTLQDKDFLLTEAPGCHSVCGIRTPTWRECTVREPQCRAVCQSIDVCRPDGIRPIHVCAVVRDSF